MKHLILRYTNDPKCVLRCPGCYLKGKNEKFTEPLVIPQADEVDLYVYHNDLPKTQEDHTLNQEIAEAMQLCPNPSSVSSILSSTRFVKSELDMKMPHVPNYAMAISLKNKKSIPLTVDMIKDSNVENVTISHTIGVESPETLTYAISLFYFVPEITNIMLMVKKPVESISQEAMNILLNFCKMFSFIILDECIVNMISGWDCTKHNGKINISSDSHVRHVLNGKSYCCMYPSDTCLMGQKSYTLEASDLKYLQDLMIKMGEDNETRKNN
jgi:hypothetical protein